MGQGTLMGDQHKKVWVAVKCEIFHTESPRLVVEHLGLLITKEGTTNLSTDFSYKGFTKYETACFKELEVCHLFFQYLKSKLLIPFSSFYLSLSHS